MSRRGRAWLGLVVVGALLAACAQAPPPAEPLDEQAQAACEAFADIGGPVRRGELKGPELYRELQDVYDVARTSDNEDVDQAAQRVLTAAISNDRQAMNAAVTELQQACGLPFD